MAMHLLTGHPLSRVRRACRGSHPLAGRTSHATGRSLPWRILYKLHPLFVAESTPTEGSSVFYQVPKETSLHGSVTFPNNDDLRLNNDHFTLVFP